MKNLKDDQKIKRLSEALRINLKRRKSKNKKETCEKIMKNKTTKLAVILILSAMLISCGKKTERVGYFLSKEKLDTIKINQTSEQSLLNTFGEPTTKSSFGPKIYYYMEHQYEQVAFFYPKLKEQKIVAIELDAKDIIKKVTIYGSKDANVLNYDSDQIMIKGNQIGVLEQFASNIGKFSSKAQKGSAN